MLPVRSAKLTPGTVARRVIEAPGLRAFVVVGVEVAVALFQQGAGLEEIDGRVGGQGLEEAEEQGDQQQERRGNQGPAPERRRRGRA